MIRLLPEPKELIDKEGRTAPFSSLCLQGVNEELLEVASLRFWNY
jgi:hypothetical protein